MGSYAPLSGRLKLNCSAVGILICASARSMPSTANFLLTSPSIGLHGLKVYHRAGIVGERQRYSESEIAQELVISTFTARADTSSICRKLDVPDRREVVLRARSIGNL